MYIVMGAANIIIRIIIIVIETSVTSWGWNKLFPEKDRPWTMTNDKGDIAMGFVMLMLGIVLFYIASFVSFGPEYPGLFYIMWSSLGLENRNR